MTSEKDVHAASPTQEPLSQRMSDSWVAECVDRAFLMTDIQIDHPSDIGEKTPMDTIEGSKKSIPSEFAPIEGEDQIITPKKGSIVVYKPSEELLRVINSTITPEGGALKTLASDMKVDVCKGSESSGSQLLMETFSLQIYEEAPLHQDVSGAVVNFHLSNPLSVGIKSADPTMSDTLHFFGSMPPDQAKGDVERVRTLDGSSENDRVGVQPHYEGETKNVTTYVDDVLNARSLLPEVLLLPPPIKESGDDEAPSKMSTYTYYDQIWVYSALEAFKCGISKEDFMVISNLQRLDIINALEQPEPIRLSLQNHILTSEDKNSIDSENSDSTASDPDSPPAPQGDKVTRSFLPHGVSSKAEMGDLIISINHLGAHIIDLNATVSHLAYNVKDHPKSTYASISSLQESQTALSQRLNALEANQTRLNAF